jgi:hypothetical protein
LGQSWKSDLALLQQMLCSLPASNAGSLPGFLRSRLQKMPFEYNTAPNFEFV